jgi:hypothetical protein
MVAFAFAFAFAFGVASLVHLGRQDTGGAGCEGSLQGTGR